MALSIGRLGIPLCELYIVVPAVGDGAEAVALRDDVEEDKQALLDADVGGDLRGHVGQDPVRQFEKGALVKVGKVLEAVGHGEEQLQRAPLARGLYAAHV